MGNVSSSYCSHCFESTEKDNLIGDSSISSANTSVVKCQPASIDLSFGTDIAIDDNKLEQSVFTIYNPTDFGKINYTFEPDSASSSTESLVEIFDEKLDSLTEPDQTDQTSLISSKSQFSFIDFFFLPTLRSLVLPKIEPKKLRVQSAIQKSSIRKTLEKLKKQTRNVVSMMVPMFKNLIQSDSSKIPSLELAQPKRNTAVSPYTMTPVCEFFLRVSDINFF